MNSSLETVSPTRVKLTIEVSQPELQPSLDKAFKSLSSQIRVKGFRPGRVPPRIVEQYVGRGQVLTDAVNDAVPKFYTDAVREHDVRVVAQPDVEITSIDDDEGFKFTAEVDIRPTVTLPDFSSLTVTVENPEAEDDAVDARLGSLRERFAILQGANRPVESGDHVSIDLAASVAGTPVPEAETSGLSYEVGSDTLVPGLDDALVGLEEGGSATFESQLMAGDHADKPAEITVTVRSVKEKELPDLDDEFAKTASEFDTIEELRADIAEQIGRTSKMQMAVEARDLVLEALAEIVDPPLPQSLLDSEIEHRRDSIVADLEGNGSSLDAYLAQVGETEESFEEQLGDSAKKAVRNMIVLEAVADQEELEIGDEEFNQVVVRRAMTAGMSPDEYARQAIEAGNLHLLVAEARRAKAFALVLEHAKVLNPEGEELDLDELVGAPKPSEAEESDEDAEAEGEGDELTDEAAAVEAESEETAPTAGS